MLKPTKILVPTDFSEYSDKALKQAIDIAKQYNAEVYILNVVAPIDKYIIDYCTERSIFPLVELYQNQESFFEQIQKTVPAVVLLALPGVSGLNAAEHLRSLYPGCGVIWCSDLDFSLHAFRLRVEYFFMEPVDEQKIREGFSVWLKHSKAM